jgi:hypothetical protein
MFAVLVACLISSPTSCETYEMPLVATLPQPQFFEAQTWAVEFEKAHPGLMIVGGVKVVRGRGV